MQTFMPYPDFSRTAKVLDMKRLGKQRVEAKQILLALEGEKKNSRFINHPAVQMWKGYNLALCVYGYNICWEWRVNRGYEDSVSKFFELRLSSVTSDDCFIDDSNILFPSWIGDKKFHHSHKCKLLQKNFEHYSKYFKIKNYKDVEYIWNK